MCWRARWWICICFSEIGGEVHARRGHRHGCLPVISWHTHTHTHTRMHARTHARTHAHAHAHSALYNIDSVGGAHGARCVVVVRCVSVPCVLRLVSSLCLSSCPCMCLPCSVWSASPLSCPERPVSLSWGLSSSWLLSVLRKSCISSCFSCFSSPSPFPSNLHSLSCPSLGVCCTSNANLGEGKAIYDVVCDDGAIIAGDCSFGGKSKRRALRALRPWRQSSPGMRDKEVDGTIAQGPRRQKVSFEPGFGIPARYCSIHL